MAQREQVQALSTPTSPETYDPLLDLREKLRQFSAERDWDQFHSPKNLAISLSIEASELLEHFQWLADERSSELSPAERLAVSKEMADVLLYLVRIADKLNVDLIQVANSKLVENAQKYPVEKAKGSSKKYTDL